MIRVLSLLPLCLLLLFSTACEKTQKKEHAQILRLNLTEDPISLDPHVVRSLKDLTVVKQVFEGLMRQDPRGTIQPAMAQTVKISDDLLTYTFFLRDAQWNNGDAVTAYDFKRAWVNVLDPSFATDYAHMLYPIKNARFARLGQCTLDEIKIHTPDEKTLIVELESPTPYFLELTCFPTYFPLHEKGEKISNGPFQIKDWAFQRSLVLEKNEKYWDKDSVSLQEIAFSIISDNNTESQLFEKDELDWLGQPISHNLTPEILEKMRTKGQLDSYGVAGTLWFEFNTKKAPFDRSSVRKAFSYAIDRRQIIDHILRGNQMPATGPLPPSMEVKSSPYFKDGDVSHAREVFETALCEAGWTKETFPKVILNYPPTERNTKIVQLVQQQWRNALGIEVELQAVENSLYRRNVRQGLFQVGIGQWIADFNDPLSFLELFKFGPDAKSGNGMNNTGWVKDEFASLLDHSLVETDKEKRKELFYLAEKILIDDMPVAPVYHFAFDYVKKPYVTDVLLSPLGVADFKYAKIR